MFSKKSFVALGVACGVFLASSSFAAPIVYSISNQTAQNVTVTYPKLVGSGTLDIVKVKDGYITTKTLDGAVSIKPKQQFTIKQSKSQNLICVYVITPSGFKIIQNSTQGDRCVKRSPGEISVNMGL